MMVQSVQLQERQLMFWVGRMLRRLSNPSLPSVDVAILLLISILLSRRAGRLTIKKSSSVFLGGSFGDYVEY